MIFKKYYFFSSKTAVPKFFVAFHFVISKNLVLMLQKIISAPAGHSLETPVLKETITKELALVFKNL